MPIGTPKYLTAAEIKEQTFITELAALDDSVVDKYILRVEDRIDAYFGKRDHHPDDEDTHRVFPRAVDEDSSFVPYMREEVKKAVLYSVEQLFFQGNPQNFEEMTKTPLESENITASGYSYNRGNLKDSKQMQKDELLHVESRESLDSLNSQTYALSSL